MFTRISFDRSPCLRPCRLPCRHLCRSPCRRPCDPPCRLLAHPPPHPPCRSLLARWLVQLASLLILLSLVVPPLGADSAFDIDTADAATLAAFLPGVGPVKAKNIVAHREAHGPFGSIERLIDVPGIGPVTLEKIRIAITERNAAGQRSKSLPSVNPDRSSAESRLAGSASPRSTTEQELAVVRAVQAVKALALQDAERNGLRSLAQR